MGKPRSQETVLLHRIDQTLIPGYTVEPPEEILRNTYADVAIGITYIRISQGGAQVSEPLFPA